MTALDGQFKALLASFSALAKPLGFRKERANLRLFQEDGLCRIINFQKSRRNHREHLEFFINLGVYFEKDVDIRNRQFKEYDCFLRKRLKPEEADVQKLWLILPDTDIGVLFEDLQDALKQAQDWFQRFPSRVETIEKILNGEAQAHSTTLVMHYGTAKLLTDMGYGGQVYEQIKDSSASRLMELAKQIKP